MDPASRSDSPRELARSGWASRLAVAFTVALAFLGLSGLWSYLAPFSLFSQFLLLAHVAIGVICTAMAGPYLVRHLGAWMRQKATASMFLGWALLAVVVVAIASGLWLTGESLWALRLSPTWDLVHLVGGLAGLALVIAHLVAAILRRIASARTDRDLAGAMASFGRRSAGWFGVVLGVVLSIALGWPQVEMRFDVPADYTLPAYAQEFDEYRGNPFAPTYARTHDGRLVSPELLSGSVSCGRGGCHSQIVEEWQPSAHRFAAMNPPFQEVQRRFAADREVAETRYCAGCHDPISLFAGAKDLHSMSLSSPGVDEGISCVGCHAISKVDERGNADYELTPPEKYLWESEEGWKGVVGAMLVRAYPRQHLADYDRNLLRSPEFCAACHKQFIPEALNRFGLVEGQNQYDEWRNGHWHSEDPAVDLSCRDCHMRLTDSTDPGHGEAGDRRRSSSDGKHRHHGFIATNNFMPEVLDLPNWRQHVKLTEEWMRGETVLPEIAELFPAGPVAGLTLVGPKSAAPGERIEIRAVVANRKAGHNFITGPLDFIRSWVHMRVLDGDGSLLAEWGQVDPETRRIVAGRSPIEGAADDGVAEAGGRTLILEATPVDEHGEELRQHELWKKAGGRGKRVIFPLYSDAQTFELQIPHSARGTLKIVADLNYRRYRQEFLDLVVPDLERTSGVQQPSVTQASSGLTIDLVAGPGG